MISPLNQRFQISLRAGYGCFIGFFCHFIKCTLQYFSILVIFEAKGLYTWRDYRKNYTVLLTKLPYPIIITMKINPENLYKILLHKQEPYKFFVVVVVFLEGLLVIFPTHIWLPGPLLGEDQFYLWVTIQILLLLKRTCYCFIFIFLYIFRSWVGR